MSVTTESHRPGVVAALILTWVTMYTAGLPKRIRERRTEEIRSDIWEHYWDRSKDGAPPLVIAIEALGRAARGVAADLFWRLNLEGEPRMVSKSAVVRAGGLALLLIGGSFIGMIAFDYGIGSEDPYFSDDFPVFAENADERGLALIFAGVLAVVAILGAGVFLHTFRAFQPWLAGVGAAALLVAGICMVASVTAGLALVDLAEEWLAAGSVRGDGVWVSAQHVAEIYEGLGFFSFGFLIAGLTVFGALIVWKAPIPRWAGTIGAMSGISLLLAVITNPILGDSSWWFVMLSGVLGLLWLVVTGIWLALRGVYTPSSAEAPA